MTEYDDHFSCDNEPLIRFYAVEWDIYDGGIGPHRLDGPINSSGSWFIHGKNVTVEIYQFAEENDIDLENLTDEDKVMIALKFG